jgi:putative aldouronate transport system substrate-binding protein
MIKFRKTRKMLALVVASLTVATMFSGCGKEAVVSSDPSVSTAVASNSAAESTEAALKPVTIKWYLDGTPNPDQKLVLDEANKVIQKEINATLVQEYIDWGQYDQKMKLKFASNEEFDICFTAAWANNIFQNIASGRYADISEIMDKNAADFLEDYPSKFYEITKVNGKHYFFPAYTTYPWTDALWFRQDYVEKYNFDINTVKKISDVTPFLETIKKNEPNITPFTVPGFDIVTAEEGADPKYFRLNGGVGKELFVIDSTDNKVKMRFDLPEQIETVKTINNWYVNGYVSKDAATKYKVDPSEEIRAGKYATGLPGSFSPGAVAQFSTSYGQKVVMKAISKPLTGNTVFAGNAVSVTSKNPERAVMLMNLLWKDYDLYNLLSYGIKDKHYKVTNAETSPISVELIKDSGFNTNLQWEMGNCMKGFLLPGDPADAKVKEVEFVESSEVDPYASFIYNAETLKKENAALQALADEYLPIIMTGMGDPDKIIPEFRQKLVKSGLEKVVADAQAQFDAWRAANGK